MKILVVETGGRPLTNDDLVVLQSEATDAAAAQYLGHGAFIISGCNITGNGPAYNVGAGIVFIDGEMMRFYGAGAVTLPAQFQRGGFELLSQRTYQTGSTKTCIKERVAVLVASDPTYTAGEFVPLDTWGGKRWTDVQRAAVRYAGEIHPVGAIGYDSTHYDTDGVGKPGTPAWGWALLDGQGGREDLSTRVVAGASASDAEYAPGATGGRGSFTIQVSNLPANTLSTQDVATFTGNTNGKNLTKEGLNGWEGQKPRAGIGEPIDIRPPFIALPYRIWVGY